MADDQHSETACGRHGRRQHLINQDHFLKSISSVNSTAHWNHEIINQQQRSQLVPHENMNTESMINYENIHIHGNNPHTFY